MTLGSDGLGSRRRRPGLSGLLMVFVLASVGVAPAARAAVFEATRTLISRARSHSIPSLIAAVVLRKVGVTQPRVRIIQRLLNTTEDRKYLEIGVKSGGSILRIDAKTKIGVDPLMRLSWRLILAHPRNARSTQLYRLKSDRFFRDVAHQALKEPADVIFIDGLHTHEQSLRDLTNSLVHLREGGWIVLHDCNPPHAAAAIAAPSIEAAAAMNPPGWNLEWCGDVWKTIVQVRSTAPDLQACVLDTDFGLGLIRKGTPTTRLRLTPAQIRELTYEDLAGNRHELLNLKPPRYLDELLGL